MKKNWEISPFGVYFNTKTRKNQEAPTKRFLSDMKGIYVDDSTFVKLAKNENPLVYEFYGLNNEIGTVVNAQQLSNLFGIIIPLKEVLNYAI